MKANKPFSFKQRCRSIQYAWQGFTAFLKQEHNAGIHLVATIDVIVLAIVLKVSRQEWLMLMLVMALVWMAELFNTAIERLCDLVSPGKHPQIGIIKDIAAAAVLVMAIVAIICGCIIFIPRL